MVRRIKTGGQGVVYEAVQESTNRRVAIKITRESMGHDLAAHARFQREIEVLSEIRSPNVAGVTDGGDLDGRLYFVTDYISGQQLDHYLATRRGSLTDVLELFATICEAVSTAHMRGIVHRDLKPSNILVDGKGQPHVLDFGLAKLINPDDQVPSHWRDITVTGQFVGSLPWATPEQIEGDRDGVDIRTDVYALGVILCQMLTGEFPYEVAGPARMVMNNIIMAEPEVPESSDYAVKKDLRAIILKCLKKDPDRRYQSAGELARDVRRYLKSEPIEARLDSTWYFLSRTVRLHRALLATLAVFVAATATYAVTATMWYQRAQSSEQHVQRAFDMIARLLVDAQKMGRDSGTSEDLRKLLLELYSELTVTQNIREDDPTVQSLLADVLILLGGISLDENDVDQAETYMRQGLALLESLVDAEPDNLRLKSKLSIALVRVGDTVKMRRDHRSADHYYRLALQIDEELVLLDPDSLTFQDNLLWSYHRLGGIAQWLGEPEESVEFYSKHCAIAERLAELDPHSNERIWALIPCNSHLADMARRVRDFGRASIFTRKCVDASLRLVQSNPNDADYLRLLARSYRSHLSCLCNLGSQRSDEKQTFREEFFGIAKRLVDDEPRNVANLELLASSIDMRYDIASRDGHTKLALQLLVQALEIREAIYQQTPDRSQVVESLTRTLNRLSSIYKKLGDHEQSVACGERALSIAEKAATEHPSDSRLLFLYASQIARVDPKDQQRQRTALEFYEKAAHAAQYSNINILNTLWRKQESLGQLNRAIETLQAILALPGVEGSPLEESVQIELCRIHGLQK